MTAQSTRILRRKLGRSAIDFACGAGVFVILFGTWELLSRSGIINPLFFSAPSRVLRAGEELVADGSLLKHIWASGEIFLLGFGMAVLFGVPIGVAIGWFKWANRAFSPLVSAFYTTPRIALMPLFIIWFGLGIGSKVALVFLSAIFPLIVNMQVAMVNLDQDLKRVGIAYGANQWQLFRTIALPISVPFLLTGLRLAMGRGLLGMVAAEVFGGSEGIGYLIEYAGATFRPDMVFVGVFIIAGFGIVMDRGLFFLNRRVDSWRGAD
jgi:ABC-type nitrate/sulfonate/bicarbonate transport system permease component